jgi:hypothetical protein
MGRRYTVVKTTGNLPKVTVSMNIKKQLNVKLFFFFYKTVFPDSGKVVSALTIGNNCGFD